MKIGLTIDTPATAVADAQLAEQLGFDYVARGEHLFFHGPVPNSLVVPAASTRRGPVDVRGDRRRGSTGAGAAVQPDSHRTADAAAGARRRHGCGVA
jgi:hypothetical protein